MIVVDTNVLAYLLIPGKFTESAEKLLTIDSEWAAPVLWRSELRNVLATYVRAGKLELIDAVAMYSRAASIVGPDQYDVDTLEVLRLSSESGCSAYDCEYVALAEFLGVRLVTADAKVLKAFPKRATALSDA
ncbi:MAG: type II toxin-antitoxin system VapC family toxin [Burkholderiales bacterium]|nr:type II toxin-antitoxin system VapC family toxin [Burkholderiales bacterium]MBP7521178.1 type II toxin-antitoxin system VapC family toxin [Leptothrix sp. (in: b-proteobacteria)]HQY07819.1 type II toxin-antitoxin system VapC family toxin [Burkholderiaceae bacterium]